MFTKQAFSMNPDTATSLNKNVDTGAKLTMLALGAGMALKAGINMIRNSTTRSALIEDLMTTDPILKTADKSKVLSYYATICNVAPSIATDKNMVRYALQRFIELGMDINLVKSLADTHGVITKNQTNPIKDFF